MKNRNAGPAARRATRSLVVALILFCNGPLYAQLPDPDWQESGEWEWYTREEGDRKMFEARTFSIGTDALSLSVLVATPNDVAEYGVEILWLGDVEFLYPGSRSINEYEEEQRLRYRIGSDRVRQTLVGTHTLTDSSLVKDQQVARRMIQQMQESQQLEVGLEQPTGELTALFSLDGLRDALRQSGMLYRVRD